MLKENAELRAEQFILQEKVQRLDFLEQENAELRNLLSSSAQMHLKTLAAQLLEISSGGFNQEATVNKGKHDGLYVGQPVLDAKGILGQIIAVGLGASKVMLLTDSKSAIPAMIVRNGVQVIVIGTGSSDILELANFPETSDVKVGDFLVSSSLGQHFPEGHPVGIVNAVKHAAGERFMQVIITPSAEIGRSRHVLLAWMETQPIDKDLMQAKPIKATVHLHKTNKHE